VPGFTNQVNLPAVGARSLDRNTSSHQHRGDSVNRTSDLGFLYLLLRSRFFMLPFHFVPEVPGGRYRAFDFALLRRLVTCHLAKYYGSSKKYQIILFHIRLPRLKKL
jgi:hypothetical protein